MELYILFRVQGPVTDSSFPYKLKRAHKWFDSDFSDNQQIDKQTCVQVVDVRRQHIDDREQAQRFIRMLYPRSKF